MVTFAGAPTDSASRRRRRDGPRKRSGCGLRLEALEERCLLSGDMVLQWNEILQDSLRISPPLGVRTSRNVAMVQAAVYDAVNSIDGTYTPYLVDLPTPRWASKEAAVAVASHDTLVGLYPPQQERLDQLLAESLEQIADGPAKLWGMRVGQAAAQVVQAVRQYDGHDAVVPYNPKIVPGIWRPTPPAFAPPNGPQWPYVRPFVLNTGYQFRVGPPPALTSAEYTAAFHEVKEIGALNSKTRTADQTEIARFWEMAAPTSFAYGHWNQIARTVAASQGTSLVENARLFALVNFGLVDGSISCWDTKYTYNYWRPITAIREADTDGNPDTEPDPTWTPLLNTPPIPAYTSGHSAYGAAAAAVLAHYFGDVNFTIPSESVPGVYRSFTSFGQAAVENAASRLYAGIHWGFDNWTGFMQGWTVGDYVFTHALAPRRHPGGGGGIADAVPVLVGLQALAAVPGHQGLPASRTPVLPAADRPSPGEQALALPANAPEVHTPGVGRVVVAQVGDLVFRPLTPEETHSAWLAW